MIVLMSHDGRWCGPAEQAVFSIHTEKDLMTGEQENTIVAWIGGRVNVNLYNVPSHRHPEPILADMARVLAGATAGVYQFDKWGQLREETKP